ncbi:MAG TPA: peptidyl-prolyl cis-trans isomerase [Caldisericia bacterium]|nr:peptidyl-prolyl cis-trans isomerase [Caldisericia bacterium]HXK50995.1 peptidyl-prolyl cis-trans isomerase [Caldisericia bacterium]
MKQNLIALLVVLVVLAGGIFFIVRYEGISVSTPDVPKEETETSQNVTNKDPKNYSPDDVSPPETIVCTIGDDLYSFTMDDFIGEMYRVMPQDFEQTMSQLSAPDQKIQRKQLEEDVMNFLIETGYVTLYFQDSGLEITEEEINSEIESTKANIRQQSGKDDFDADQYLTQLGVTEEMIREDMYNQIMFRKVFSPMMDNVTVTDQEVQQYYNDNTSTFALPDQVNIDVILTYDEKEVQEIIKKYQSGEDFNALAEEYVKDPQIQKNRGVVGWVAEKDLPQEMSRHIFNDEEYGDSDIVFFKMETVHYIVRKKDFREAHTQPFDEIKEKVRNLVLDQKKEQVYKDFIEEQKKRYGEPVINPSLVFPSDVVTSDVAPNTLPGMEGMVDQFMEEQKKQQQEP